MFPVNVLVRHHEVFLKCFSLKVSDIFFSAAFLKTKMAWDDVTELDLTDDTEFNRGRFTSDQQYLLAKRGRPNESDISSILPVRVNRQDSQSYFSREASDLIRDFARPPTNREFLNRVEDFCPPSKAQHCLGKVADIMGNRIVRDGLTRNMTFVPMVRAWLELYVDFPYEVPDDIVSYYESRFEEAGTYHDIKFEYSPEIRTFFRFEFDGHNILQAIGDDSYEHESNPVVVASDHHVFNFTVSLMIVDTKLSFEVQVSTDGNFRWTYLTTRWWTNTGDGGEFEPHDYNKVFKNPEHILNHESLPGLNAVSFVVIRYIHYMTRIFRRP